MAGVFGALLEQQARRAFGVTRTASSRRREPRRSLAYRSPLARRCARTCDKARTRGGVRGGGPKQVEEHLKGLFQRVHKTIKFLRVEIGDDEVVHTSVRPAENMKALASFATGLRIHVRQVRPEDDAD